MSLAPLQPAVFVVVVVEAVFVVVVLVGAVVEQFSGGPQALERALQLVQMADADWEGDQGAAEGARKGRRVGTVALPSPRRFFAASSRGARARGDTTS